MSPDVDNVKILRRFRWIKLAFRPAKKVWRGCAKNASKLFVQYLSYIYLRFLIFNYFSHAIVTMILNRLSLVLIFFLSIYLYNIHNFKNQQCTVLFGGKLDFSHINFIFVHYFTKYYNKNIIHYYKIQLIILNIFKK